MRSLKAGLITGSLLTPLLVAGAMLAQAGPAAASTAGHHQGAVFVAKNASPSGSGQSCNSAKYSTISAGLKAAPAWSTVQPEVARWTRACSYDRPGSGYSDPGPLPRSPQDFSHSPSLLTLATRELT